MAFLFLAFVALIVLIAIGVVIWGIIQADSGTAYATVLGSGAVFGVAICVLLVFLPSEFWGSSRARTPAGSPSTAITYRVTGTVPTVSLTYNDAPNRSTRRSNVAIPWEGTFTAEPGQYLYLSVVSTTQGKIECRILSGSAVLFEASGDGVIPSAICSGIVPY